MVKILECSRCHHLFKTNGPHMMIKMENDVVINFCADCSEGFCRYADLGMKAKDLIEDHPLIRDILDDWGISDKEGVEE